MPVGFDQWVHPAHNPEYREIPKAFGTYPGSLNCPSLLPGSIETDTGTVCSSTRQTELTNSRQAKAPLGMSQPALGESYVGGFNFSDTCS
jgi:hypothetical protein